jgi:hypothetical protein
MKSIQDIDMYSGDHLNCLGPSWRHLWSYEIAAIALTLLLVFNFLLLLKCFCKRRYWCIKRKKTKFETISGKKETQII